MSRITAFMITAFNRPSTVGAVLPSSRRLAVAMARAAGGSERLIELGAGTGAITAALCRHCPGVPILAVELEPELARHLRKRFPTITVRAAPAHEVLCEAQAGSASTVLVSSLPFRSLPPRLRLRSSLAIEKFLLEQPLRRLVQYTYLPWEPFPLRFGDQLRWRKIESVWRNAPPAWVWELSPQPAEPGRPGASIGTSA